MADLEDRRQPPRVVADLCVPVPLKQTLARKPLFLLVMGGRRQLDHLSDSFLTELRNKFLLGTKGNMDLYSPGEIWIVQADFPYDTMASDGCSMGLQLKEVIADVEHFFGITTDCKIGVSQINVACFPHVFLLVVHAFRAESLKQNCFGQNVHRTDFSVYSLYFQVPNRGMDGEQGLEVVQESFGLSEEEETKLYSKYPAKIQWSGSLDMRLHCKKVNFKRGFNVFDKSLIEGHNFVPTFNGTILGDHPKIASVPWSVSKGRPLKSSYNAEDGHAVTIMHELGVQRALMLGAGTGSSSSNAVMVNLWLDSGASCHVVGNEEILSNRHDPPAGVRPLRVADGVEHEVESIGTIDIPGFKIPNVRFIRRFENLISVGQLAKDHKIRFYLDEECCVLWVGQSRTLVGEGIMDKRNGLYRLTFLQVP